MSDTLLRAIARDAGIQICAASTTELVERAHEIHSTTPLATAALGRTLTATAIMGSQLKAEDGSVTVQIKGNGPLGAIVCVGDSDESEQIPSACALGVLVDTDCSVKCAGGWLVQLMPGVKDSDIDKLEANLAKLESMTAMLDKGMSLEDIIRAVLDGFEVDFLQTSEIGYRCACSREKVERALISMGKTELCKMAEEQENSEVTCQFCDKIYHFSRAELQELLTHATK